MATLLDEILQETKIADTRSVSPCKGHRGGCGCSKCKTNKLPVTGRHKLWKERRSERLNKKKRQTRPIKNNLIPAINSELGNGGTTISPNNRIETFKVTAKSFIMTIGSNIGSLPLSCGITAPAKLFAMAKITDSIMSENPVSDNKNGMYRLYSSITFRVLHDGNKILVVNPMILYPGSIETHVGDEKVGPISFTPPDLTIDLMSLSRRDNQTFVFGWRALGRPPLVVEPSFQLICPRTSRYIWHRMYGEIKLINGSVSISARVGGSQFPSHRAYVNGRITDFVRQGPFSNLWVADATNPSRVQEISVLQEILNESAY